MIAKSSDDNKTIVLNGNGLQFISGDGGANSTYLSGISDSKGTSSDIAVSQKCLSDNYIAKTFSDVSAAINLLPPGDATPVDADYYVCQSVNGGTTDTTYYRRPMSCLWSYINGKLGNSYLPLTGGTLTGTLTATKFTGKGSGLTNIPAGQLTGTISSDRLPDLSGKYLPISGGTITGDTTVMGSTGQYGVKFTNGYIQFLSDGGATVRGTITGISSSKGTSTTRAISEKGVADNYIAKTDISNIAGTDTTKVPSLQCLNDNYVPKSGGLINGTIGIAGNIEILGNDTLKLSTDGSITFPERASRLTGIADDKGISTTLAVSQKCLNDNYLAKSDATYSTTDLTAGTSPLTTGSFYFVYE